MSDRKCICQLCTCTRKIHKCKYDEGEETLKAAGEAHCRRCGCQKKNKPYVPMAPMETSTTYGSDYQPKSMEPCLSAAPNYKYNQPAAPMEGSTTYNSDFTDKPVPCCGKRKENTYIKPMGDMNLSTTYNGDFNEKPVNEKCVSFKPPAYRRPMGPMDLSTTYGSDYTEKPVDLGYEPCCVCCDPQHSGYMPAGEENGHMMYVKRG